MIKKVLVGVDINIEECMPLEYAASLCKILEAELVALHVVEELQVYSFFGPVPALKREEIMEERRAIVMQTELLGERFGIKATGKLVEGISPTEELLREVQEEDIDLIVIGCHGRSVLMEALLGGVSSQIVHHSKVPVLVVKNPRGFSKILMCTGGSKYAADAMEYASLIAEKAGSEVTILSVSPSKDPKVVEHATKIAGDEAETLKKRGINAIPRVSTGHPAEEILKEARKGDYRLIVMGYKGTSAVVDILLGDVVSKVMHHSRRPTLIFRENPKRDKGK
jgi:nucleotide-binding universal stress UspA family protein